jgi:hypothetical protein
MADQYRPTGPRRTSGFRSTDPGERDVDRRPHRFSGYDEKSHREIVDAMEAAGAHGEARRARERYAAAVAALEGR